ncbi:hypothetical protein ACP70R_048556 [Stipagrostis hirtigluma subsp. patula]
MVISDPGKGLVSGEDSFHGERPLPGDGSQLVKPTAIRSLDYPCVTRLRLRRLLAFFGSTRFSDSFEAFQSECSVFLDLSYVQRFVKYCLWDDARKYLLRILPYDRMGVEGRTLVDFIVHLSYMHPIFFGHPMANELLAKFECCGRDPKIIRDKNYVQVMYKIVSMRTDKVRASLDWGLVGLKAAEIVRDFIAQSPEFREFLRLPRRSSNIYNVVNVLPFGFRPRQIRQRKKAGRVPGSVIAKYFLPKGRFLPSGQGMGPLGLDCQLTRQPG